jgi:hypothetical protein
MIIYKSYLSFQSKILVLLSSILVMLTIGGCLGKESSRERGLRRIIPLKCDSIIYNDDNIGFSLGLNGESVKWSGDNISNLIIHHKNDKIFKVRITKEIPCKGTIKVAMPSIDSSQWWKYADLNYNACRNHQQVNVVEENKKGVLYTQTGRSGFHSDLHPNCAGGKYFGKYEGEYTSSNIGNEVPNGQGKYNLFGVVSVGEFRDGELFKGIHTWGDGSKYVGEYKMNVCQEIGRNRYSFVKTPWNGINYDKDGNIYKKFENGVIYDIDGNISEKFKSKKIFPDEKCVGR